MAASVKRGTKKVNARKPGRAPKPAGFVEMVSMMTKGVDEMVGPDGTRIVNMAGAHMRRVIQGLTHLRSVAVRLVPAGTGPAVARFFPGSGGSRRIIRTVSDDVRPYKKMTFETRLTGGIREAIGWLTRDNALVVELGGYIGRFPGGAAKFRNAGNDFSTELKAAGKKAVGKWRLRRRNPATGKMETYERAHLWGFIFGDEARDGIMYAPAELNQFWQSKGVETWIRELGDQVHAMKGKLVLRARAESYSPAEITAAAAGTGSAGEAVRAGHGEYLLKKVTYELFIESPQKPGILQPFTDLIFEIPPPWRPNERLKLPRIDSDLRRIPGASF